MALDPEILKLIHRKLGNADEKLATERETARREAAGELAAKGLLNSGGAVKKNAEVYGTWVEKRVAMYLDTYLETLQEFRIKLDGSIAKGIAEELAVISQLYVAIPLPPGVTADNRAAMQAYTAQTVQQQGNSALRLALTRLEQAKLLVDRLPAETTTASASVPQIPHVTFTGGDNSRVVFGSDYSHNSVSYDARPDLEALERLSAEHGSPDAAEAAKDVKESWPDASMRAEGLQRWIGVASSSVKLMTDALPYLQRIYAEVGRHLP